MKIIKRTICLVLIVLIIVLGIFIKKGYDMYKSALDNESIEDMVSKIKQKENYTTFDELPEDYINAVIAVEDRRFYTHKGIDLISISRAIFTDIKSLKLVEGGSTITQQLAKNTYFTQTKKFTRKCAEIFMAKEYEKNCDKNEIFELYVNTSYYGDGYYCIKDASLGYFGKEPSEMSLYECTLLAGIPNAPSVYAPTKNPELAKERQAQVIKKMLKYGYLSEDMAEMISDINYNDLNY